MNISKRENTCLIDNLRDFLKIFDQASKCIQIPLPKPKVKVGSTKSTKNLVAHYYNEILNIQIDKFVYHSDMETTIPAYFPIKTLNYTAIKLFLQKLSTLTNVKFTISTRTDITLQTIVKNLRAITMCSAFTPNCGYDNSTIILIGDVYCPNTNCLGKICLHKKTFQSLGRSDNQCPQSASVYQVSKMCQVHIFEESPKAIQDVIGEVFCPGIYCSTRKKCKSLGGYVTTTRSI